MTTDSPQPVDPPRPVPQWTRADLAAATRAGQHGLIDAAFRAGQLRDILTQPTPDTTEGPA